mmetsp:Transcript_37471/g.48235  ORF Transcript_37471/g.48235 Transcript_37471/m.48235 type:complete len:305 (+) Transcript_37471:65-979(+)
MSNFNSYSFLTIAFALISFVGLVEGFQPFFSGYPTKTYGISLQMKISNTKSSFASFKIPLSRKERNQKVDVLFGKGPDVLDEEEEKIYTGGKIVLTPEQKRVRSLSNAFQSTTWLSWWAQVILSTVAGVILFFAGTISDPMANVFMNGSLLAGCGVVLGLVSTFWTWGYAVSAKKWKRPDANLVKMKNGMLRRLKVGQFINILGMLIAIVGAEQIVGTLVAKVLSAQGLSPFIGGLNYSGAPMLLPQGAVQALDIFIVQANTNTVLGHLVGLLTSMYLRTQVNRLVQENPKQGFAPTQKAPAIP